MTAIFPKTGSGAVTISFPDVCKIPASPSPIPTPYADAMLLNVEPGKKTRIYKIRKGRVVEEAPSLSARLSKTFVIADGGEVVGRADACSSTSAARAIATRAFGAAVAATVVSLSDDGRPNDVFRVTARTTKRVIPTTNPPDLIAAIRGVNPLMPGLDPAIIQKSVEAFRFAHDRWKLEARFAQVSISGPWATGQPGCLLGSDLYDDYAASPAMALLGTDDRSVALAAGRGISDNFAAWQSQVTVPGLPWYPAFAAWPGPMAPPTPNVPVPLIACVSGAMNDITDFARLRDAMIARLADASRKYAAAQYEPLLTEIGLQVAAFVVQWLGSQPVHLVMGQGPVPSYAPPYVPVGPVSGGWVTSTPGHLA